MTTSTTSEQARVFEAKRIKNGLKVRVVEVAGTREFELTHVMWEGIEKLQNHHSHHSALVGEDFLAWPYRCDAMNIANGLRARGLMHDRPYQLKSFSSGRVESYVDHGAATELAVELRDFLAKEGFKCPPEEEWPQPKSKREPPSPTNVRVTPHQRELLQKILKEGKVTANKIGEAGEPTKGWARFGDGFHPMTTVAIQRLLVMDLVEVGASIEAMCMVCRLTIHGALLAKDENG